MRQRFAAGRSWPYCWPDASIAYTYCLGVVISGNWLLQDPLFSGESAVGAYLPSPTGGSKDLADQLWREIGIAVVPADPPPTK